MGLQVKAVVEISEEGFHESEETHVHAFRGDIGEIVDRNGEYVVVKWRRSGTVCDCHPSELDYFA